MVILSFMAKSYTQNMYIYENRKFEGSVPSDYHQPVKEYAAALYGEWQINNALVKEYIT